MKTQLALPRLAGAVLAAGVLALGAGAATAADNAGKPVAPNQCFWTRNITGFAAPDDHTVYIRVSFRDVYRLDLMVACPDVEWNQRIALVSRSGSNICNALDAEIVSHATGLGRQRCPVKTLTKLSPAEIAALPRHAKP
jgi:hypothetical protein